MPLNWMTTLAGIVFNILYAAWLLYSAGGITMKDALIMAIIQALSLLSKDFNQKG
jgi:hypothetical protein